MRLRPDIRTLQQQRVEQEGPREQETGAVGVSLPGGAVESGCGREPLHRGNEERGEVRAIAVVGIGKRQPRQRSLRTNPRSILVPSTTDPADPNGSRLPVPAVPIAASARWRSPAPMIRTRARRASSGSSPMSGYANHERLSDGGHRSGRVLPSCQQRLQFNASALCAGPWRLRAVP